MSITTERQFVVGGIAGVVFENIENELFLNRLAHRVAVGGFPLSSKHGERFVLGRGG